MKLFRNFIWIILLAVTFSACAEKTTVRKEIVDPSPTAASSTKVVETETVVEKNESTSVLGSVFDVIGEVIALPFRLVAGIFRFVF